MLDIHSQVPWRSRAGSRTSGAKLALKPVHVWGVRIRLMILQRKTGRPVQFEVTEQTRRSVANWIERKGLGPGDWLFPSRKKQGAHLSTRQYARLVDRWITLIGLDPSAYGTHSRRRTKVSLLFKKTGNLRPASCWAIQSWKARSGTSELRLMMRWNCQRLWSCRRFEHDVGLA